MAPPYAPRSVSDPFHKFETSADRSTLLSAGSPTSDKESNSVSKHAPENWSEDSNSASQKPCRLLGSAYDYAQMPDSKAGVLHHGVPERFLKSVMRRYLYGKIWHFDNDGNSSSDELSESSSGMGRTSDKVEQSITSDQSGSSTRRRRHRSRQADAEVIQSLFPGVRALMIMPMWDTRRQRFFAGAVAFTYSPLRILTAQEDLTFLGAFCDVIMAEVGRLDAQNDAQAKESFISSISHELKSPLHGILGGVECLQDNDNASNHEEILQIIDTSGRSLLDIINHLLEHAHMTSKAGKSKAKIRGTGQEHKSRSSRHARSPELPVHDLALLTEEILDTAIWSAPAKPQSDLRRRPESLRTSSYAPVETVLEIDSENLTESNWFFQINAGAWKRIVQNLTSNSIKYTDPGGYLKVSLSTHATDNGSGRTMVELVCADSGRGMSQEYLENGLWRAFSQENSHASGTGLGLSLVGEIIMRPFPLRLRHVLTLLPFCIRFTALLRTWAATFMSRVAKELAPLFVYPSLLCPERHADFSQNLL